MRSGLKSKTRDSKAGSPAVKVEVTENLSLMVKVDASMGCQRRKIQMGVFSKSLFGGHTT